MYHGKLHSNSTTTTYRCHCTRSIAHAPRFVNSEAFCSPSWLSTYPRCFYFIPRGTAPSFPVWKNFTFLPFKTWLHVTPPLLFHYWSYRRQKNWVGFFHLGLLILCTFKEKLSHKFFPPVSRLGFEVCFIFVQRS